MATTLVLYFSTSGTTKRMAQTIANLTGADLHEIKAPDPYTQADLDWHDPQSRTSIEQHEHQGHVACVNDFPALDQYDTIIIGHPIWWGIPPRLIANAIDQLPLDGKTLATFATSGGSGYQRSQSYIQFEHAFNQGSRNFSGAPFKFPGEMGVATSSAGRGSWFPLTYERKSLP